MATNNQEKKYCKRCGNVTTNLRMRYCSKCGSGRMKPLRGEDDIDTDARTFRFRRALPYIGLGLLLAIAILFIILLATGCFKTTAAEEAVEEVAIEEIAADEITDEEIVVEEIADDESAIEEIADEEIVVETAVETVAVEEIAGKIFVDGKEVGTKFDNRLTITCGEILYPETSVGEYTEEQLKKIASTWIEFNLEPNGMLPMVFGGGLITESTSNNEGVAAYIGSREQIIQIRNGELVLWNNMDDLHADIESRMAYEIQNGNKDIPTELAFKACSAEVAGYFPSELLENNDVEIIDFNN